MWLLSQLWRLRASLSAALSSGVVISETRCRAPIGAWSTEYETEAARMQWIKSVYDNQNDILRGIRQLHLGGQPFDCDMTYGNGAFWKHEPRPASCFDVDSELTDCETACSTSLPLPDASINSAVFDPPFLTYVRANREGNGDMIMARRFSGYWRYDELENHYRLSLEEAARILVKKGVLVVKCQDIVHNHALHCTHANVIRWGETVGFKLKDLFILTAKHRLPSPNKRGA